MANNTSWFRVKVHEARNMVGWAVAIPCLVVGSLVGGNLTPNYQYTTFSD
jgi:hypothetical protein